MHLFIAHLVSHGHDQQSGSCLLLDINEGMGIGCGCPPCDRLRMDFAASRTPTVGRKLDRYRWRLHSSVLLHLQHGFPRIRCSTARRRRRIGHRGRDGLRTAHRQHPLGSSATRLHWGCLVFLLPVALAGADSCQRTPWTCFVHIVVSSASLSCVLDQCCHLSLLREPHSQC